MLRLPGTATTYSNMRVKGALMSYQTGYFIDVTRYCVSGGVAVTRANVSLIYFFTKKFARLFITKQSRRTGLISVFFSWRPALKYQCHPTFSSSRWPCRLNRCRSWQMYFFTKFFKWISLAGVVWAVEGRLIDNTPILLRNFIRLTWRRVI